MRKILNELEEYFAGLILIALTLVVLLQITARTFSWSIVWTEEISRFLFIWSILLGVSAGIKHDTHVGTEYFVNLLPPKGQRVIRLGKTLLFIIFTCYMTITSFSLVNIQFMFKKTASATGIPMYLISAALPVGFLLSSLRLLAVLINEIKPFISAK